MGGSQKSKRITWAPDVNLCQVRLFSSAKPPSEVGMGYKDHLRAKALPPCSVKAYHPEDTLPPGFEEFRPTNLPRVKSTNIPLTKWRCPPRFEVNSEWQVVSGEESKEVEAQNQRERRVLEAIYPWPSAIPPSPRAPENAEESVGDDQNIPLIPLTPIEEQADVGLASSNSIGDANRASTTPVMQPDIAAALASIPCQSNLIDRDLLVRILSDQKVIQQLFSSSHGASSTQCVPEVKLEQKSCSNSNTMRPELNAAPSSTQCVPEVKLEQKSCLNTNTTRPELNAAPMPTAAGPSHPPQLRTGFAPPLKDPNYYKTLIQQHGGGNTKVDRPLSFGQSNRVMGTTTHEYQSRSRMMKRCMFFNTSRGCKNGANCMYQHDAMFPEIPTAKRVKLGR